MNIKPLRLLLLLAALSLASCTDPRANSISRLHRADAAELRAEVTRLSAKLFPASGPTMIPVRPEMWPAALLKLRPLRMNLYRDGLAVSLQASPGYEYGLHILPPAATDRLESTERTQYEKLQDGIYYFTQKR
jgi:hypothetical protein